MFKWFRRFIKKPKKMIQVLSADPLEPLETNLEKDITMVLGKDNEFILSPDNIDAFGDARSEFFTTMQSIITTNTSKKCLVVYNDTLYICNVFVFLNSKKQSMGGLIFIRKYFPDQPIFAISCQKSQQTNQTVETVEIITEYGPSEQYIPQPQGIEVC